MFFLARELKLSSNAAAIAAFIFAFSEHRYGYAFYSPLSHMQWMPLTLVFVHRYFVTYKVSHLIIAAVFFSLVSASCGYYFMFFSILCAIVFMFNVLVYKHWKRKQFYNAFIPAFMIVIATVTLIYYPYLQVQKNFGFYRPLAEQIGYGASLENFLASTGSYVLHDITSRFSRNSECSVSERFTAVSLVITLLFYYWKKGKISQKSPPFTNNVNVALALSACLVVVFFLFNTKYYLISVKNLPHMMSLKSLYGHLPLLTPALIITPLIASLAARMLFSKTVNGMTEDKTMFLYLLLSVTAFAMSLGPLIKIKEYIIGFNPLGPILYGVLQGYNGLRGISRAAGY
ncbi:MAG: hypothetical protein L7F77_03230 [Candidatus Magnetominusculus sp. LBB02]|nr:hypothetical protein [Candidatus Magnetominusculus sp. LBB02]